MQNKLAGANVADEMLEAQQVKVFRAADDDVAVGVHLIELVDLKDGSSVGLPFSAALFDQPLEVSEEEIITIHVSFFDFFVNLRGPRKH